MRNAQRRLRMIADIIEQVDQRCLAVDGPVTPTLQEMTQTEMSLIYKLATGAPIPARVDRIHVRITATASGR